MQKTAKQLENYLKGVANHRRISILNAIAGHAGITAEGISELLNCNIKTVSEHTWRLVHAGLIEKRYHGRTVEHGLTSQGKSMLHFLKTF